MWYLIFYQNVSCLSTNREVNKHHDSHCLEASTSIQSPVFLAFESIEIYFATTTDERRIVEWSKALVVFVLVIM